MELTKKEILSDIRNKKLLVLNLLKDNEESLKTFENNRILEGYYKGKIDAFELTRDIFEDLINIIENFYD